MHLAHVDQRPQAHRSRARRIPEPFATFARIVPDYAKRLECGVATAFVQPPSWPVLPTRSRYSHLRHSELTYRVQSSFPWSAIIGIGVFDQVIVQRVKEIIGDVESPKVAVRRAWYY